MKSRFRIKGVFWKMRKTAANEGFDSVQSCIRLTRLPQAYYLFVSHSCSNIWWKHKETPLIRKLETVRGYCTYKRLWYPFKKNEQYDVAKASQPLLSATHDGKRNHTSVSCLLRLDGEVLFPEIEAAGKYGSCFVRLKHIRVSAVVGNSFRSFQLPPSSAPCGCNWVSCMVFVVFIDGIYWGWSV